MDESRGTNAMILAFRLLILFIAVQLILGVFQAAGKAWRTQPQLPADVPNEPLISEQLRELANAAAKGTDDDYRRLGEALLGKGFYSHAELAFRNALRTNRANYRAQFGLAFSLDRTGRMQESTAEYRKVLGLPDQSAETASLKRHALYAMGRNALRLENVAEAEELFLQNNGFAPADYQAAKLMIRSGRPEPALPIIANNLKAVPFSLEFHFLNYRALTELGRHREAFYSASMMERSAHLVSMNFNTDYVAPLDQMTGISPLIHDFILHVEHDEQEEAIRLGSEIQSLVGDSPSFAIRTVEQRLIELATGRGDFAEARRLIEQLRSAGLEAAWMLETEGDLVANQQMPEKAAMLWKRALNITPSISLHEKLASHLRTSETEPGRPDHGDDKSADWHLARAAFYAGVEKYRRNQLQQAVPLLQTATQLAPDEFEHWYYLGEMHFHLSNLEEARIAYQRCLSVQAGHEMATEKLEYSKGSSPFSDRLLEAQ